MNAVASVPARTTTFVEATHYLLAGGIPAPDFSAPNVSIAPVSPNDWLQHVRDTAEKIVPTMGRHRDHYCVATDGFLRGHIVVTRDDSGIIILDAIVAVPF